MSVVSPVTISRGVFPSECLELEETRFTVSQSQTKPYSQRQGDTPFLYSILYHIYLTSHIASYYGLSFIHLGADKR